jgi:hypothetical protein
MYSGGSGTVGDPYQIANLTDLLDIASNMASHFILTADINLGGSTNWPIGHVVDSNSYTYFTGSLNGSNYKIHNGIFTSTAIYNYGGIFAGINSAYNIIQNLTIENIDFEGESYVGALCGICTNSCIKNITVNNCTSTGVTAYVGGLIGSYSSGSTANVGVGYYISNINITSCTIIANNRIGGIIGNCQNIELLEKLSVDSNTVISVDTVSLNANYVGGIIGNFRCVYSSSTAKTHTWYLTKCSSDASITGYNSIGGLIGYMSTSYSYTNSTLHFYLEDCYSTGNVTGGENYVGGIAGIMFGKVKLPVTIQRCYSTGSVSGMEYLGGIAGSTQDVYCNIKNCFALNSTITRIAGSSLSMGRICGDQTGIFTDNYANESMQLLLN